MKVAAIIPARGGSKGLPKKNIKLLDGKPLIAYTIEEAKKSQYIVDVYVSTDDKAIADIAIEYGAKVPYMRPDELSSDSSPTIDAILHMTDWIIHNDSISPDIICVLQCTSPLRRAFDINRAIKKLIDTDMDACVSVCEAEVNPYWTNVFVGDTLEYFLEEGKKITKRQDLPKVYRQNGAVYAVKIEVLLKEKTLEPKNITGYIMNNTDSIDIDTIEDFILAEFLIQKRKI